jgi:glycosyltransferase involved in cell wall biosynthesis
VPGRVGGSETYVRGLLSSELGERLTVFPNERPERSDVGKLLAITAGMTVGRRLRAPVDVLHYPLTVPVPRFAGPTVVTLHDLQHIELPSFFSRAERLYRRFTYDGAARRASVVVTPSEHARSMAVSRLGLDGSRVVVAPHGVDHERFTPDGPEAGPERFLYYPANLWPHKNHRRLLEGLARAQDRSIELVLSGKPDGSEELLALAGQLGVGDRVTHLGYVSHHKVPALLRGARAMIFPSLFEGFGQPPLEAMACGCAVASSARGALAEVCSGAVLELDPLDVGSIAAAIDVLACDDALVADLGRCGPERARAYTWARSAALHMEAYEQAVSRPDAH